MRNDSKPSIMMSNTTNLTTEDVFLATKSFKRNSSGGTISPAAHRLLSNFRSIIITSLFRNKKKKIKYYGGAVYAAREFVKKRTNRGFFFCGL